MGRGGGPRQIPTTLDTLVSVGICRYLSVSVGLDGICQYLSIFVNICW